MKLLIKHKKTTKFFPNILHSFHNYVFFFLRDLKKQRKLSTMSFPDQTRTLGRMGPPPGQPGRFTGPAPQMRMEPGMPFPPGAAPRPYMSSTCKSLFNWFLRKWKWCLKALIVFVRLIIFFTLYELLLYLHKVIFLWRILFLRRNGRDRRLVSKFSTGNQNEKGLNTASLLH